MKLTKSAFLIVIFATVVTMSGCIRSPESPEGFSLPVGDKVMGEAVFEVYHCRACHRLYGEDAAGESEKLEMAIVVGGKVSQITTYAELVTSVINPSHKISAKYARSVTSEGGKSKMENYNDVMTISELIDLVAFLQSKYELKPYDPTQYGYYH